MGKMRLLRVLATFALTIDLGITAPATAVDIPSYPAPAQGPTGSGWLASGCSDIHTVGETLPSRPVIRHRTLASPLPHRPAKRRHAAKRPARHVVKHRTVRHGPVLHRKHALHRKPRHHVRHAHARPTLHKVTYASPLCIDRSHAINALLGLPDVPLNLLDSGSVDAVPTQLTGTPSGIDDYQPSGSVTGPGGLGGSGGFGDVFVPGVTGGGGGGGTGSNGGGTVTTIVPEPATWGMMILGFVFVGAWLRRRRPVAAR